MVGNTLLWGGLACSDLPWSDRPGNHRCIETQWMYRCGCRKNATNSLVIWRWYSSSRPYI